MRKPTHTLLLGAVLACMLAGTSMPLMAAVYKCTHNGEITYSDTPCGANQQVLKKPKLVVTPAAQPAAAPENQSSKSNVILNWLGLDSQGGLIAALLFGIPFSIIAVFFMTRKKPG